MRQSRTLVGLAVACLASAMFPRHAAAGTFALAPRQQQDAKSPLYLDEPACDSYQCSITYRPGDTASSHWLNAPAGNVELDLLTNASSVVFTQIAIVPGVSKDCKAEKGQTCGQFKWVVPSAWVGGNYTLRALSTNNPNVESYTDVILVVGQNGTDAAMKDPVYFKALDPVATDVEQPTVVGAAPGVMSGDGSTNGTSDAMTPASTFTGAGGSAPTTAPNSSSGSGSSAAKNGAHAAAGEISLWSLLLPIVAAAITGGIATVHT